IVSQPPRAPRPRSHPGDPRRTTTGRDDRGHAQPGRVPARHPAHGRGRRLQRREGGSSSPVRRRGHRRALARGEDAPRVGGGLREGRPRRTGRTGDRRDRDHRRVLAPAARRGGAAGDGHRRGRRGRRDLRARPRARHGPARTAHPRTRRRQARQRPGGRRAGPPRPRRPRARGLSGRRCSASAPPPPPPSPRRDAVRLFVAVSLLVAALTAILSIDLLPQAAFRGTVGDLAPTDVYAPRAGQYTSVVATAAAREEARRNVEFAYDYSPTAGQLSAAQQLAVFERTVAPVDAAFGAVLSDEARQAALSTAIEGLSPQATTTLQGLDNDA